LRRRAERIRSQVRGGGWTLSASADQLGARCAAQILLAAGRHRLLLAPAGVVAKLAGGRCSPNLPGICIVRTMELSGKSGDIAPPAEPAQPTHSPDGVDLTLIRWTLSLTPLERLELLQSWVDGLAELRDGRPGAP
jgi:hypothetical protein